ncbi:hypothetical protein AMECASPLE_038854, partial [Ameca splendens]
TVSSPVSSSFPVQLIVGAISEIVLIILLVLLCCYRRSKDLSDIRLNQSESRNQTSAQNHGVTQTDSPVYSSLLHGDTSLYETIQPCRTSGNGKVDVQTKNFNTSE